MNDAKRFFRGWLNRWLPVLMIVAAAGALAPASGCNSNTESVADYTSRTAPDCLPNLTLTDQNGSALSLASLKGKPVLFDFFYTTCPGPCLVLTARMKAVADKLGPALGSRVWFVSVSVDPEHDDAAVLHSYVKEQGASRDGWYFLTGTPAQIDDLMARFKLKRERAADGSIEHVLEFFVVGPNGRQLEQYMASDVTSAQVAGDLTAAAGHPLAAAERHGRTG